MSYVGKGDANFQANSNEPLWWGGLMFQFTSGSEDLNFLFRPGESLIARPTGSCYHSEEFGQPAPTDGRRPGFLRSSNDGQP